MKRLVEETALDGLEKLMGQNVTLFCMNYIYHGKLVGVNDNDVVLKTPSIVYETGSFSDPQFKDAQSLCADEWFIRLSTVESFGVFNAKQ